MEINLKDINRLMDQGKLLRVRRMVSEFHPADLARLMEELSEEHKTDLFAVLDPKLAAEVVVELSDASRDQVLRDIHTTRLADIVDDMPSDEATDIIAELPSQLAEAVLERIDDEDSSEVRTLLQYPEDTAGGIMQLELVSIRADQTIAEAIVVIRSKRDEIDDLHNIFVVDAKNQLMGLIPLQKLVLTTPETQIGTVMEDCPLVVMAEEDQEGVAHKVRLYDVISVPVVDERGRLIGRITSDDIMEVLDDEHEEDILRMAGASTEEEPFHTGNILKISRLRLPWLLANMGGGLVSGGLLWLFRVTLSDALFLIAFIPVIMAMAGNVGVQSSTIIVRGFAVGQVTDENLGRILLKELKVAMVIGLVCGVIVGVVAQVWHNQPMLGLVVGGSMTCAISLASLMGTLAPAAFKRLNVDPAISSGPVVTTVNDMMGILIYFGISMLFYRLLIV
jgi:magnesium transporter